MERNRKTASTAERPDFNERVAVCIFSNNPRESKWQDLGKTFDENVDLGKKAIFPLAGGCSEGLNAFRFFFVLSSDYAANRQK